MRAPSVTILTLALAGGCSGPPTPAADAGDSPDAQLSDAELPDAEPPEPCAPGRICLDVVPHLPGQVTPDGRLVVVFFDATELNDAPPFVAYDAPFPGTSTVAEIDLAAISPPVPPALDDYQICTRPCVDPADPACDCVASEPEVALAFVFATVDVDDDGSIGPVDLEGYFPLFGVGYMHLALSDDTYPSPGPFAALFPDGLRAGLAAYRIIPGTDRDALGFPADGARFALNTCAYVFTAECQDMPFPSIR